MALDDFEAFVRDVDPKLRRALSAHYPREEVSDAVASAFEHAWKHWPRVRTMENPAGYLYRVAQSKSRIRKQGFLAVARRCRTARLRTEVDPRTASVVAAPDEGGVARAWVRVAASRRRGGARDFSVNGRDPR